MGNDKCFKQCGRKACLSYVRGQLSKKCEGHQFQLYGRTLCLSCVEGQLSKMCWRTTVPTMGDDNCSSNVGGMLFKGTVARDFLVSLFMDLLCSIWAQDFGAKRIFFSLPFSRSY